MECGSPRAGPSDEPPGAPRAPARSLRPAPAAGIGGAALSRTLHTMRALVALCATAALAGAGEPLPLKSVKLAGETYTLAVRQKLESGRRLTLGPGTRVVGQGKGGTIDLEGTIEVEGKPGAEVVFENVWIVLGWKFRGLEIARARFEGSGGVYVPHERETRGKLFLDHVKCTGDASVWVTFHEGDLELRHVTAQSTCQIAGTGSDRNVKLEITSCQFVSKGLATVIQGGLRLHNVKEAEVRDTGVDGMIASFVGGAKLTLEGCRFDARSFAVRQKTKGRIGKTKIVACDFGVKRLHFDGPEGGRERVVLHDCHFRGDAKSEPDAIERDRIEAKGVRVVVRSPRPEPNDRAAASKSK